MQYAIPASNNRSVEPTVRGGDAIPSHKQRSKQPKQKRIDLGAKMFDVQNVNLQFRDEKFIPTKT